MGDYILREIDKIGKLLAALLQKVGVMKENKSDIVSVSKLDLLEGLNIDIDQLLQKEDFIEVLTNDYHFSNGNLETFAELIFDFIEPTTDIEERQRLVACISKIYGYLDINSHTVSFHRYHILTELKKYL